MNNFFLCFTLLVLGVTNITAQERNVKFGVKAGLNVSTIAGDNELSELSDARASFHAGVLLDISLSDKFALQPELVYSSQGITGEFDNLVFKLDYLNIPVMAKYYIVKGLSIQAGPQLGVLLSAKMKVNDSFGESENDLTNEVTSIDFGVNFGVGYQFDFGLFFDGRYNLGLSSINNDLDGTISTLRNSVFQLSVGYKF